MRHRWMGVSNNCISKKHVAGYHPKTKSEDVDKGNWMYERCHNDDWGLASKCIHMMIHCLWVFFLVLTGSSGYRFRICLTRSSKTSLTCQFLLADVSKKGRFHRCDRFEIVLSWTSRSLTRSDLVPTTTIGTVYEAGCFMISGRFRGTLNGFITVLPPLIRYICCLRLSTSLRLASWVKLKGPYQLMP